MSPVQVVLPPRAYIFKARCALEKAASLISSTVPGSGQQWQPILQRGLHEGG